MEGGWEGWREQLGGWGEFRNGRKKGRREEKDGREGRRKERGLTSCLMKLTGSSPAVI